MSGGSAPAARLRRLRTSKPRQNREGRCGIEHNGLRHPAGTHSETASANWCRKTRRRVVPAHPCSSCKSDSARPRAKGRRKRGTNRGRKAKKGHGRLRGLLKRLHSRLRLVCYSRRSTPTNFSRSEERRVGKEGRSRWWPYHLKKKNLRHRKQIRNNKQNIATARKVSRIQPA